MEFGGKINSIESFFMKINIIFTTLLKLNLGLSSESIGTPFRYSIP